jgi:predicted MFS family arabinose efflux permease
MMDASDPDQASTDYTLLACAIVVAMGLANVAGAALGDAFGYAPTFVAGLVLSTAGCLLLVLRVDVGRGPARLAAVWRRPDRLARLEEFR